jgi:hypothetical protein
VKNKSFEHYQYGLGQDEVDEVICGDCGRGVNLYTEEIYHKTTRGGTVVVYLCRKCVAKEGK